MKERDEWLKKRLPVVNSTESPALFGMSPYVTAYELGVQKQAAVDGTLDVVLFEDNARVRWGRRLQDSIAQGIADDYGVVIESQEFFHMIHPACPRMGSSFDFRIVGTADGITNPIVELLHKHGPGLLEIKNVDVLVYRDWPEHDAPDHIEIQVQHQLEVAQVEWCVLGVLVGGNRTEVYTRMRDQAVGAAIVKRVAEFWANLERGILPPAVLPEDADIIIRMHQYADPGKVFDGQEDAVLAELCQQYTEAQRTAKEWATCQLSLKARILKHIGEAERALVNGYKLSASMRAPSEVKAHTRAGFRDLRITRADDGDERTGRICVADR